MCAKLVYFLLGAFLTFNIITIVAFVYLPWWQALIVVFSVILAFTWATPYLTKYFARSALHSALHSAMQMSTQMMEQQGRVLKNASVTVHGIRPAEMPQEVRELLEPDDDDDDDDGPSAEELARAENLIWREIELTIFPDPQQLRPGDPAHWNPHSLCLVPETWTYDPNFDLDDDDNDDGSLAIYDVQLIGPDGQNSNLISGDVLGVQRLRFVAGIPRHFQTLALAYLTEKFGQIRLPSVLPPARPQ